MPTFAANATYAGTDISQGSITNGSYFGNPVTNPAVTYTLAGSFSTAGVSTITVTTAVNGTSGLPTSYTYDGYYYSGGIPYYVFSPNGGNNNAISVSLNGAVVPTNVSERLITTGTVPVCFLRGTAIATPDGETAVEDLVPGDAVAVLRDGVVHHAPVAWIGRRTHRVPAVPDLDDMPVRIRAGAIRDGVPRRDLLVTPEHCLFLDGHLVPARMLVNGASIIADASFTEYEFFHVELDRHSILLAEGLEAESYLDTGNRANFGGTVQALRPEFAVDPTHRSWHRDAAAPLGVSRAVVEPIWQALADRAVAAGDRLPTRPELHGDPDLRVVTETGLEIAPALFDGTHAGFVIPGGMRRLHLASRAARPSETVGPFLDDRRLLGVQVGACTLTDGRRRVRCDAHLAAGTLPGWHAAERDRRWTDGHALLPVDLRGAENRPVLLTIEIVAAGPYPARPALPAPRRRLV